jgi:superoxide dismutase
MAEITDPNVLSQLEGKEVTDPTVLSQLEGKPYPGVPFSAPELIGPMKGFVGNVLSDIPKTAMDFMQLANPQTWEGMGNIIKGAVSKLPPTAQQALMGLNYDISQLKGKDQYLDNFKNELVKQFGSWDAFLNTLYERPIATGTILTGLVRGVTGIAGKAGEFFNLGGLTKGAATVGKVATAADPFNIGQFITGKAIEKAPQALTPERFAQSAAKYPKGEGWPILRRQNTAEAQLERNIYPTLGSYEKNWQKITEIGDKVQGVVDTYAAKGESIPVREIWKKFDELKDYYKNSPNPQPYLDTIQEFENGFNLSKSTIGKGPNAAIPLDQAYKTKQWVYEQMGKRYESAIPPGITADLNMAVADGIREHMANRYPEIANLLKEEHTRLEVEKAIRGAVKRIPDKDLIGLGGPLKIVASSVATGRLSPGAWAWIAETAPIKTAIGKTLYELRKKSLMTPAMTTARQGALGLSLTGQSADMRDLAEFNVGR